MTPQYFKEIILPEVLNIKELKIFYVLSFLESGRTWTLFFMSEEYQPNALDWLIQYFDYDEMVLTKMLVYYPPKLWE